MTLNFLELAIIRCGDSEGHFINILIIIYVAIKISAKDKHPQNLRFTSHTFYNCYVSHEGILPLPVSVHRTGMVKVPPNLIFKTYPTRVAEWIV